MMKFGEFCEQAKTKYVEVVYDDATQKKLRDWAVKNGFDLSIDYEGNKRPIEDFEFHTTIFFTTSLHDIDNTSHNVRGTAKVIDIAILGDKVPVLKVRSDEVSRLRKIFEKEVGMRDQWPSYIPHVSLSYSPDVPDISKIVPPDFELKFDRLNIKDAKTF